MLVTSDKDRLLFIPGPVPVHRSILAAIASPTMSHTSSEFASIMKESIAGIGCLVENDSGYTFIFSGSGTLAQEAAIVNFVSRGERLLVVSNGFFGDRMSEIGLAFGIDVKVLRAEWGQSITPEELDNELAAQDAHVVAVTHVETSTGTMAPLESLLNVIHRHKALAIVDGVCALGAVPEPMTSLGIDVLISGSQKAIGMPPGLSIVSSSKRAWEKRETNTASPSYYADLRRWRPVMENPEKYFSTHSVNLIYGLHQAISLLFEEGLERRFRRHLELASLFRAGLVGLGFQLFTNPNYLAPTLTVARTPEGVPASEPAKRPSRHRSRGCGRNPRY